MVIDGNTIAQEIQKELAEKLAGKNLSLAVVFVGDDSASKKFIERKKRFGDGVGVSVSVVQFSEKASEDEVRKELVRLAQDPAVSGIIVQLPLPAHFNTRAVVDLIPPEKDVDALSSFPLVLSPFVGAVRTILERHGVAIAGKNVVVVGQGALVGMPVAAWAREAGAKVISVDKDTEDIAQYTRTADILVTGAGVPGLITRDMIRDGAILIDAGTSESAGKLVGDIDPSCVGKAALFTPVPGGVGPLTVALLFLNLIELSAR